MNRGFIKLQRELLMQPKVADLLAKEGAAGLGLYVAVNLYLAHCEGGWGVYNGRQLSTLAVQLKKHRSDAKRVICDYGLFVVEGTRFTSHWMQQLFGKDAPKMLQSCSTPACTYNSRAEDIDKDIEKENKEKADVRVSADTHSAQGEGPAPAQTDYRSYNNYLKR